MGIVGMDAVGRRVRVYWVDEDEWFGGCVQDVSDEQGFFVLYDDGDERWEAPAQLVEFEKQQQLHDNESEGGDDNEPDQQQQQQQVGQRSNDHAPRMMEPPASPIDADDDDEYDDDEHKHTGYDGDDVDGGVGDDDDVESVEIVATLAAQSKDGEDNDDDQQNESDGEQSIAMSEVPITFERVASGRSAAPSPPLTSRATVTNSPNTTPREDVNLPVRGVLRGKVLRASHLPSLPSAPSAARQTIKPPRAFVKIAFVEAATGPERASKSANVMLRCKNALASTSVAQPSSHPVWNDPDDLADQDEDGAFQMQLVPPSSSRNEPPAWLQLRGDVIFSVYSVDSEADLDERVSGHQVPAFIGQAVVSLREILQEVIFGASPCISRQLRLVSRQGKPLIVLGGRVRRAFSFGDDEKDEADTTEIVVAFEFEPTFAVDVKQITPTQTSQSTRSLSTKDRNLASSASMRSLASQPKYQQAKAPSKPTTVAQAKQTKKAPPPPSHTSSSNINRLKFAKQIDQQNVAFAKRIEWQDQRRARRSDQAKAQAKSKQPVPQYGSMKLDHKASSSVNRTKFQQQVRQENRAMEKRLHAIVLKDESKASSSCAANGEQWLPKFSDIPFDAHDKDQVLARDRRQQRLREQDFVEKRAQATYQQQNAVVEEVLKLQSDLAELRAQVSRAKMAVTRLDILNNKDRHLCQCLRSAAEAQPAVLNGGGKSIKRKATTTNNATKGSSETSTEANASITRQRKELELLLQEASSLNNEKQLRSQELRSCNQQQQELDDQIQKLTSQLRFVQAKQVFQQRMDSRVGGLQLMTKEMKKKAQLLELSSEEEELWALYKAQQELTQLQIAVQVLKERHNGATTSSAAKPHGSLSTAASIEYLEKKIEKQKQKLKQLEQEQCHFQREYEALAVSGTQETLRKQVHELQQTLFLCQSQQKHARGAQRHAKFTDEKLTMELQTQVFIEQTETEILFKKKTKAVIE